MSIKEVTQNWTVVQTLGTFENDANTLIKLKTSPSEKGAGQQIGKGSGGYSDYEDGKSKEIDQKDVLKHDRFLELFACFAIFQKVPEEIAGENPRKEIETVTYMTKEASEIKGIETGSKKYFQMLGYQTFDADVLAQDYKAQISKDATPEHQIKTVQYVLERNQKLILINKFQMRISTITTANLHALYGKIERYFKSLELQASLRQQEELFKKYFGQPSLVMVAVTPKASPQKPPQKGSISIASTPPRTPSSKDKNGTRRLYVDVVVADDPQIQAKRASVIASPHSPQPAAAEDEVATS